MKNSLTPQQLFEHRLCSLLGLTLDQFDELPAREIERWHRYWREEPWGSYSDNRHAAWIIVHQLRSHMGEKAEVPDYRKFMFETGREREARVESEKIATRLKFESLARIAARKKKQTPEVKKQKRVKR